jgi:hypothetical protein
MILPFIIVAYDFFTGPNLGIGTKYALSKANDISVQGGKNNG